MTTTDDMAKTIHQGRNVKRFREMLGIKQEGLAFDLGDDWNQKKVSLLEQKEEIEPHILEQLAKALKVPVDAIKNFDQETALNIFSNTYHDNSSILGTYNFNPIDKLVEALDENKKLYEKLLQSEREKNELLQKLLNEKNK